MDVGVVGGTGREGFGLATRLARAGHRVTIGSRAEERGRAAAERAHELLGGSGELVGGLNETAARAAEVLFLAVPFAGQAEICRGLRPHLREGVVVVDTTAPLASAVGGSAWQVVRPWHGSAAEQAAELLGPGARVVSGFHSVSARALNDLENPVRGDVFLAGDDREAKGLVGGLVETIPELRWVDVGELSIARVIEPLTAMLVSVNRVYKTREATFRVIGRDAWGRAGR